MAGNAFEPGRSVASKLTAILMTFTEGAEHSLTEIARRTRLPISTTHRLATELAELRVLDRVPDGRYRAGLSLRRISGRPDRVPHLAERGAHVLDDLATVTGRRALLGVLHDVQVSYIERRPAHRSSPTFTPSATLPVHPTALGRALLAFSPPPAVEMVVTRGLRRYTPHTVTEPDRFRRAFGANGISPAALPGADDRSRAACRARGDTAPAERHVGNPSETPRRREESVSQAHRLHGVASWAIHWSIIPAASSPRALVTVACAASQAPQAKVAGIAEVAVAVAHGRPSVGAARGAGLTHPRRLGGNRTATRLTPRTGPCGAA